MRHIKYEPAYSLSMNDSKMDFFPVDHIDPETGQAGFLNYFNQYFNGDEAVIHAYLGVNYFKYVNENGLMQEFPVSACLLGATGEASDVSNLTVLKCDEYILVACADSVFCLSLPDLNLIWKQKVDVVTCLGIYKIGLKYLIHGAFEISLLDEAGNRLWYLSSKGVSWDFYNGFKVLETEQGHFKVWDWDQRLYRFDYDGKLLNGPEEVSLEIPVLESVIESGSRVDLSSKYKGKNQILLLFVLALLISIMALLLKTYF